MKNSEIGWSDLPFDLLGQITDKVISFSLSDYIRFSCVCVRWRSFFIENYEQIRLSNLPVLLIPSFNHDHLHDTNYQKQLQQQQEELGNLRISNNYYNPREIWVGMDHKQRHQSTRSFYSLSERKVYDFQLQVPSYMNCRGSSHGWLVLVEECIDGTYPVHLLNPFRSDNNNNKIHLPPLKTTDPICIPVIDSYFLKKVIISRSPSSSLVYDDDDDELVVLGLYDTFEMGFCRPGDRAWTPLPEPSHADIWDFIFYKDQFWGILQDGGAVVYDINVHEQPKVTIVVEPHQDDIRYPDSRYLVESAGDLFQVRRDILMSDDDDDDEDGSSTVGFQVFKLDLLAMEWVKTNSLDGRMFFLGDNASISLSDFHGGGRCKPNSIYCTEDYEDCDNTETCEAPHDMGVFNLEDGSFESHYLQKSKTVIMPPPIWIQPML